MSEPIIQAGGLHKTYRMGRTSLHVLRGVKLDVQPGEFVAVVGASGSGKSTLLHLLGLLDRADKGSLIVDGRDTVKMGDYVRTRMRRRDIGFVFQFYHLLPEFNVLENVQIAQMTDFSTGRWLFGAGSSAARERTLELLTMMGLADRLKHRPRELSGGERQRVAIARALANSPKVLLADEPTGNLDSKTGGEILAVLKDFNTRRGQTLVMATHDANLAGAADRVIHLKDGRLV